MVVDEVMEGKGKARRASGKKGARKIMVSSGGGRPRPASCRVVTLCRVGKSSRRKRGKR